MNTSFADFLSWSHETWPMQAKLTVWKEWVQMLDKSKGVVMAKLQKPYEPSTGNFIQQHEPNENNPSIEFSRVSPVTFTIYQNNQLEKAFQQNKTLESSVCDQLATELGLKTTSIELWFSHRMDNWRKFELAAAVHSIAEKKKMQLKCTVQQSRFAFLEQKHESELQSAGKQIADLQQMQIALRQEIDDMIQREHRAKHERKEAIDRAKHLEHVQKINDKHFQQEMFISFIKAAKRLRGIVEEQHKLVGFVILNQAKDNRLHDQLETALRLSDLKKLQAETNEQLEKAVQVAASAIEDQKQKNDPIREQVCQITQEFRASRQSTESSHAQITGEISKLQQTVAELGQQFRTQISDREQAVVEQLRKTLALEEEFRAKVRDAQAFANTTQQANDALRCQLAKVVSELTVAQQNANASTDGADMEKMRIVCMRQNENLQAEIAAHLETSTKLKEARELEKSAAMQAMYEKGFAARLAQEVESLKASLEMVTRQLDNAMHNVLQLRAREQQATELSRYLQVQLDQANRKLIGMTNFNRERDYAENWDSPMVRWEIASHGRVEAQFVTTAQAIDNDATSTTTTIEFNETGGTVSWLIQRPLHILVDVTEPHRFDDEFGNESITTEDDVDEQYHDVEDIESVDRVDLRSPTVSISDSGVIEHLDDVLDDDVFYDDERAQLDAAPENAVIVGSAGIEAEECNVPVVESAIEPDSSDDESDFSVVSVSDSEDDY